MEVVGRDIARDVQKIKHTKPSARIITIYGEEEKITGDMLIPETGHELSSQYIKAIERLL